MKVEKLVEILRSEIEPSAGCTDPGGISLCVANAVTALGSFPEHISVTLSPNLFKNAVSVGIPGTYRSGIKLAVTLGALINKPQNGLAVLSETTPELLAKADEILKDDGFVDVNYGDAPDPLYVKAEVEGAGHKAYAVVMCDYSNVVEIVKDGETVFSKQVKSAGDEKFILNEYSLEELYNLILASKPETFEFLADYAKTNISAANSGLADGHTLLGNKLFERAPSGKSQLEIISRVQAMTAAAGEARMAGLNVLIMSLCGSGNHGIADLVGTYCFADEIGASDEQKLKALALSTMVTVYIKGYIKRMTAFCGCGVAAATGVACAAVYLLGGSFEQSVYAMQSIIGTIGGMFCDGAKKSCAYKLSTAVSVALQAAYLAMENESVESGVGIVGRTIEETFSNLGRLNDPGMRATDKMIVEIIHER